MRPGEDELELEIINLVKSGDVRAAGNRLLEFELRQERRSGLFFDWEDSATVERHVIGKAERIYNARPAFFTNLNDDEWRQTQTLAAISMLCSWSRIPGRAKVDRPSFRGLKPDVCARMLAFHVGHEIDVEQAREVGAPWMDVFAGQGSCECCQSLSGVYPIDLVPELPHPSCTHDMGCRCRALAVWPETMNADRRATLRVHEAVQAADNPATPSARTSTLFYAGKQAGQILRWFRR